MGICGLGHWTFPGISPVDQTLRFFNLLGVVRLRGPGGGGALEAYVHEKRTIQPKSPGYAIISPASLFAPACMQMT